MSDLAITGLLIVSLFLILGSGVWIGLTLAGTIGVWGWIGVVPLLTGALSTCPLYSVLGFNTCPMKRS